MSKLNLNDLNPREFIIIKNARQNNLKNVSLALPQQQFIVFTGVSGSGKSSLAFDTIYAEGQRRYVESLSAYIRQFTGKIEKPEVDYIKGLSPAIAIQQKVNTSNPRSTVGTTTEIYDYLKLLYARIGRTISPKTGKEVKRHTVQDVVNFLHGFEEGTRAQILAPIVRHPGRDWKGELQIMMQKGFTRIEHDGKVFAIQEVLEVYDSPQDGETEAAAKLTTIGDKFLNESNLLIDRVKATEDDRENDSRVADSAQTAFFEGHGTCILEVFTGGSREGEKHGFNNRFEEDGIEFEEPSVNLFSFNNSFGACRTCEGFGSVIGVDEDKVVPDKTLSLYDDAVACWRGNKMSEWRDELIKLAPKLNFPIHRPYHELSDEERDILWNGKGNFEGIWGFFRYVESKLYKIQYRVMLARYKGRTKCYECHGTRLRKEAQWVKVAGHSLGDLVLMPVYRLKEFFDNIKLNATEQGIAKRLLVEIDSRLQFLLDVGLGYLTMNRASRTLSGGESQRIQLVTSLGSTLTGSLYILDEPSIGLHPADTHRLIRVLRRLQKLDNTVIVVEHDEEIMDEADYLVDMGPLAGEKGGDVVFEGTLEELRKSEDSLTGKYLSGRLEVPVPEKRRTLTHFLTVEGATKHNLKDVNALFPLNALTVVTGVSGSGKSTLVKDIIYEGLKNNAARTGTTSFKRITGPVERISGVEYVDQNPIGKSSRSNPVTYIKAFDGIRDLFSKQRLSQISGFMPAHFSFNVDGGRCDTCKGEGILTVEMQFMADIELLCEDCNGKRYKDEVLQVEYKGKSIADVLDLTVTEAVEYFQDENTIANAMQPLLDVGLGYLKLGQSSADLSGGEAQRIKLASFLTRSSNQEPLLFIFDEPTTGLHFHDINYLMQAFDALIERGHTIMVIEHNMDVIKRADWILDLGPGGGDKGGQLVFEGRPEELIEEEQSLTGKFLRPKLEKVGSVATEG